MFDILTQTHFKIESSDAIKHTMDTHVMPFYESASLPILHRSSLIDLGKRWYETYQKLKLAKGSKPDKRAKDFPDRCHAFQASLDEVFFVPPYRTQDNLKECHKLTHMQLKVCNDIVTLHHFVPAHLLYTLFRCDKAPL